MKRITFFVLAVAFAFCSTLVYAQDKDIPNLVGTWDATAAGHAAKHGFHKKMEKAAEIVIKEQQGRIFHGSVTVNREAHKGHSTFTGLIAKDNKTIYIAGHQGGIRIGTIDGPNEITEYVLFPGGDQPRAFIADLKRVK
ncbi:MAG: hypothetical protein WAN11_03925 [Syntrophobacteraceae bacterium]